MCGAPRGGQPIQTQSPTTGAPNPATVVQNTSVAHAESTRAPPIESAPAEDELYRSVPGNIFKDRQLGDSSNIPIDTTPIPPPQSQSPSDSENGQRLYDSEWEAVMVDPSMLELGAAIAEGSTAIV